MTVLSEQENSWLNDVARRLRFVQSEAAGASLEQRREFLQEEIARQFVDVQPSNRKRYLEALLARFPIYGQVPRLGADAPAAPSASPPASESSPEALADQLLQTAAALPEDRRAALAKKLSEAGVTWVDREALVLELSDEFRRALGLPAGQQPQLTRLVQLTLLLIDLCYRLDSTALKALGELAPRSALLTRPHDFKDAVARFLTGSSESIEPELRGISTLVGGLLAAILGAGRDFGRQYVDRFAPTAIEDVVKGEGRAKWWPGGATEKELCWEKYKDLAKDFATADLVDRRIKDCLATFVEKKVLAGR